LQRLDFTESLALLGATDIHPGGRRATAFLLDELEKCRPRRVLEVGAGSGHTTERMIKRGWQVTPIEPSGVLRRLLEKRLRIRALGMPFEQFDEAPGTYDAAIGESVFYCTDLPGTFAKLQSLLRPGGLLAMLDMVWTDRANPDIAADVHRRSAEAFGVPAASAQWLTWPRWRDLLTAAGFRLVVEQRLPPDSFETGRWRKLVSGVRHPLAFAQYLRYRSRYGMRGAPPDALEGWMAVWRRV
jgi:SAM-dependent methyltransferase